MRQRRRATVGALLGLLLVAACSDGADDAAGLPAFTAGPATTTPTASAMPTPSATSSTTPTTPSATATASPSTNGIFGDMTRNDIVAGRTAGTTAAEKAVMTAWLAYWQVRAAAFFAAEVDPAALGRVSSGQASEAVTSYVGMLRQRQLRTAGGSTVDTTVVTVKGATASVEGCLIDRSADVSAESGTPVELPSGRSRAAGTLQLSGPTWRVTSLTGDGPCR